MYNLKSLEKNAQTIKPYGPQIQTNQNIYIYKFLSKFIFSTFFINLLSQIKSPTWNSILLHIVEKSLAILVLIVTQGCKLQIANFRLEVQFLRGKGTSGGKWYCLEGWTDLEQDILETCYK